MPSSDLKVLVGDLYKSGHCMRIQGFAKIPRCDEIRERNVTVSRKFCVCGQDIRFQEILHKILRMIRDSNHFFLFMKVPNNKNLLA